MHTWLTRAYQGLFLLPDCTLALVLVLVLAVSVVTCACRAVAYPVPATFALSRLVCYTVAVVALYLEKPIALPRIPSTKIAMPNKFDKQRIASCGT